MLSDSEMVGEEPHALWLSDGHSLGGNVRVCVAPSKVTCWGLRQANRCGQRKQVRADLQKAQDMQMT